MNVIEAIRKTTESIRDWAKGKFIAAPVSAKVGQTIIVKAVDKNDKPTEWETVDAAKANDTHLINLSERFISLFEKAVYTEEVAAILTELKAIVDALKAGQDTGGDTTKTLVSISASYSGGNVAVGTALSDLTGIVVVASYSDGSAAYVTDYTLSGTIAEGSNTIMVSYGGMVTTFTVTGVSQTAVVYSITNNLTNASTNNAASSVQSGSIYVATITPADGYELDTVTVTMGGTDATSSVHSNGAINIPSVTGDIVITAVAVAESTETAEYALTPIFGGPTHPDKTTYEVELYDMSGGSAQAVYAQDVLFEMAPVSGGVLHVTLDTTKLTYMRMRIYLVDSEGNPYKHNGNLASETAPVSGDITNSISWLDPGNAVGLMNCNGNVAVEIPDGYTVKWVWFGAFDTKYIVDAELAAATKPIYALVDAICFNGEVITAKVVKEV